MEYNFKFINERKSLMPANENLEDLHALALYYLDRYIYTYIMGVHL